MRILTQNRDCPINPTPSLPYNTSSILYKYSLGTDASNHTFSEDCLSINVWTKPQVGEPKKAVMLWIYGGGETFFPKIAPTFFLARLFTETILGFTTGTSNSPAYNGAILAEDEDVVVVTFKYALMSASSIQN
jgi:carboxylesterase type B